VSQLERFVHSWRITCQETLSEHGFSTGQLRSYVPLKGNVDIACVSCLDLDTPNFEFAIIELDE
jgi:hypothetical protein